MNRLFALIAAAVVVFAACGGDKATPDATSSSPTTERPAGDQAGADSGAAGDVRAVLVAASERTQAMETMRGSMELRLGGGGNETLITAEMTFQAPETMHIQMSFLEMPIEVLVVLPNFYVRRDGGEWQRIDGESLPGIDLEQLRTYMRDRGAVDMDLIARSLEQLERTGDEVIDGVSYARYEGTIDYEVLTEQSPQGLVDPALMEQLNDAVDDVEIEYLIDEGSQLPRRVSMAFDMELSGGPAMSYEMTMDFEEWGGPVDIPDEPTNAPALDTPAT